MDKKLFNKIRIALNISNYAIVDIEDIGNNVLYIKAFFPQRTVGIMYGWNTRFEFETNIRFIQKHLLRHVKY